MGFVTENESAVRLKRYRNVLKVCGKGMILLNCWTVIKATMYMFMSSIYIGMLEEKLEEAHIGKMLYCVLMYLCLLADLLLRLYVARRAIREGNGVKQKNGYIVLAALMLIVSLYSLITYFDYSSYYPDRADMIVSFIVELTVMANELEILRLSLGIRRLEKKGVR